MQALELEEFRALERQITQDSGSVRGSVTSLSSAPAWQLYAGSSAMRKSMGPQQHQQQYQQQQRNNKQLQTLVVQKPEKAQSAHNQLSETNDLLLERINSTKQAAKQRPAPRVTGNPFADPEEFPDDSAERNCIDVAAAQQPALQDGHDNHVHTSAQPQMQDDTVQQQPYQQMNFGAESAWDAISASALAADNTSIAEEVGPLCCQLA